jgi:hypothetical protein
MTQALAFGSIANHLPPMTAQQSRKRPAPIIDQDGREIRPDVLDGDGFRDSHVTRDGFSREGFARDGFEFHTFGFNTQPLTREQRFTRLEALGNLLDTAFIVPGTNVRYGIDGLIGLIPIIGDIVTTAIALWIVREARAIGAPRYLVARMLANVAVDGVVGAVPLVGDAFDVAFKANVRNVRMLRRWMDKQAAKGR